MRIALTYNEKRSDAEDEAELDTRETINFLARLVASLGHVVEPVEVSCPVDDLVRELRSQSPDLIFNLAEGRHGKAREAFFPALFEQLRLRHTGSSAATLALCMDKALANRVVRAAGVDVPRGMLIRSAADAPRLEPPVIVKPNFEGSSKGITQKSVVTSRDALDDTLASALARYPDGILVEEFIDGLDVSVGWIDGLGILDPIGFSYEPTGPHRIYDLPLKQTPSAVQRQIPPPVDDFTLRKIRSAARRSFAALGVTGYGRADFRVTPKGDVFFLDMNPLPTLSPADPDLYEAAARLGKTQRDVLACIVAAA